MVLWDFVAAFSRKIEVSVFTLEDLEASACHRYRHHCHNLDNAMTMLENMMRNYVKRSHPH